MKKQLFPLLFLVFIIFSACQNQCPLLTDQQKVDIEKQIQEFHDSLLIPIEDLNPDGYAPFVSSDEFLGHYNGGTVIPSKAAFIDTLKSWFSDRQTQRFEPQKVTINVFSKDLVLIDQVAKFNIINKDGQIWQGDHAISFLIKKEKSGWKIIHSHESNGNWRQVTEGKFHVIIIECLYFSCLLFWCLIQ
jgi:ketosteroid isomerase-like protein